MILLLAMLAARADEREDALLALYRDDKPIAARTEAEALLAERPRSIVGHYVMGGVLYGEEGDLSRSIAHLEQARDAFEAEWGTREDRPWKLHADILWLMADVAGDMDDRRYELQLLDDYDAAYNPDRIAEHAWPLMKLGRSDEAREWAQRGIDSGNEWQGVLGRNSLCAIESEEGKREIGWFACVTSHEELPKGYDDTVSLGNAAEASITTLRFAEAEDLLVQAVNNSAVDASNPWLPYGHLLLAQGRGAEAVEALKGAQAWRTRQLPRYRDQNRADTDMLLASVLLAAGDPDRGLPIATRAVDFPDRRGTTSAASEQALGGHTLQRAAMRRLAWQAATERAQAGGIGARLWHGLVRRLPSWDDRVDRAAIAGTLTDRRRLRSTLAVYLPGGLSTPSWLVGDLVPILGGGVVTATVAENRDDPENSAFGAYYDALGAEVAWWRGQRREAHELGRTALDALPEQEVLLRARVAAIAADAAWKRGDGAEALRLYERALQLDPGVIRRLGLALPAVVDQTGGGDAASAAAAILGRSPRFSYATGAFRVTVDGVDAVRTCLLAPSGTQLACATTKLPLVDEEPVSDWAHGQEAAAAFHRRAFGLPLGLKGKLSGLDGTNTLASEKVRADLEALLDAMEPKPAEESP